MKVRRQHQELEGGGGVKYLGTGGFERGALPSPLFSRRLWGPDERTWSESEQFLLDLVDERANVRWRSGPEYETVSWVYEAGLD